MDMNAFMALQDKPDELAAFLVHSEARLRPMLKFLNIRQLSNLATAFHTQRPQMYATVCAEIRAHINRGAPFLSELMAKNWTQAAKGYTEDEEPTPAPTGADTR